MIEVRRESDGELCGHARQHADESQVVCIQQANGRSVRPALGRYSMPGVPTVTVTREQLESGAELTLRPEA
jgi:hypothetical protein